MNSFVLCSQKLSGHSSVGRVQASQAWCREFESRCPLHWASQRHSTKEVGFERSVRIFFDKRATMWVSFLLLHQFKFSDGTGETLVFLFLK